MKFNPQVKAQALEVYHRYWDSYTKGDLETFASTLDDQFEMIGTSESERCHTKADGIEFLKAQLHEVVGKAEMRNRQIDVVPVDHLVLINEQCDIYVLIGANWNFYSKIRISTLLRETKDGWKVTQQHGSLPDMRVREGETIALEKISKENLELRDAVRRRTAELEHKNRELAIEAALERVRAMTMAMRNSQDVGKCIVRMFSELTVLGVDESTRFGIGIINHENENIQLWTASKDGEDVHMHIGHLDMRWHPLLKSARKAWKAQESLHLYVLEGEDLLNYYQMINNAPDYKLQVDLKKLPQQEFHYGFVFEHGFFYAFNPREFQPELIHITKRFSSLFEQTYRRYLDLVKAEAQAREAQIEAALEKVRSRSLAMHKSDELNEVVRVLFERLNDLQIPVTAVGISINIEGSKDLDNYTCGLVESGIAINNYRLPYFDHRIANDFFEAREKQLDFFVCKYSKQEKDSFYEYVIEHTKLKNELTEDIKQFIFQSPTYSISVVTTKHTMITLNDFEGKSLSDDEIDILKRFAKVFEQTYTRFLDLQKAEAQAREAQIQLSLERIRAKAMAMQHSDELSDFLTVVFEQFEVLNLNPVNCHLAFLDIENNRSVFRLTGKNGATLIATQEINLDASPVWTQKVEAWKSGHFSDVDVLFIPIEKLPEIGEIFKEILDKIPENDRPLPEDWPDGQYVVDGYCKYGYLGYSASRPPSDEEKEISRRIANEFGNVYQRFLDLEKAEAQAREAEIEVALEKVRSRSLAMHKSDDLKDVVFSVFERLSELQIQTDSTAIIVYFDESMKMELWAANDMNYPTKFTLPMTEGFYPIEAIEARKEQKVFLQHLPFEEKNRYWKELFNTTEFRNVPEARKNFLLEKTDCLIELIAFGKVTGIMLFRYFNTPFNDEEIEITERFAKVFEQAYTRFLDLQKAETQAREAQIEAALERVRSRTMAMQKSEELADAAYVLFEQLNILGVTHERINIGIVDDENQHIDFWVTEQGGQKLQTKFSGRISEPTTLSKSYEAWKNGAKSLVVDLQGEELQSWLKYMEEEIKIPFNKAYLHNRRVQTAGFFSKGMLVVTSPEPLQDEALYLLEKFAKVFDLTYTRFNDLLLAEAQAIKAKENLKAIQEAKSKAEEALTELKATQTQLVQQEKLASLGQLTAGIAHEIKNPLNFVNNFSEVSLELIEEALEEIAQIEGNEHASESAEILADIKSNLTKIHEHGTRANSIVSSMLQHSRGGSGKMGPTDLNALIKEYVNLSFHGMRAGKNPIDVDIVLELDSEIKEVSLINEDFTRVIINLCNNAFDAMRGKKYEVQRTKYQEEERNDKVYLPKLRVSTILENGQVRISFQDNGPGIPDEIKDKILQPFFTTKKGTEGTGLGLSITNDIIKAHGGELKLESNLGKGARFDILLFLNSTGEL